VKLGLIGFGGLGSIVAGQLAKNDAVQFIGVAARPSHCERIRAVLGAVPVVATPQALLALKPELVVECASHEAFRQYAEPVLSAGIDLIAVSVGVLADAAYRDRVLATARRGGATLEIPAGAIGGIDVIAAARHAGLTRVIYVTRKSPRAWQGTPAETMVDLAAVTAPKLFYDETAGHAATLFTEKANVTATLALAGIGFQATRVQFWVDPAVTQSVHHIEAEGPCGTLTIDLANNVAPTDGKASLQTAMSIVQAVRNRLAVMRL
jgi:aspartate dehydrogenase